MATTDDLYDVADKLHTLWLRDKEAVIKRLTFNVTDPAVSAALAAILASRMGTGTSRDEFIDYLVEAAEGGGGSTGAADEGDGTTIYPVNLPIEVPGLANPRYAELSRQEFEKRGYRVIGGDRGDLLFDGYELDEDRGVTRLYKPEIRTSIDMDDFTDVELAEEAQHILNESFGTIGLETVEHS